VELDELIHGLAHISQLSLASGVKIEELYKAGTVMDFEITSIEPKEHRLGLQVMKEGKKSKKEEIREKKEEGKEKIEKNEEKEKVNEVKTEKKEVKEKKVKKQKKSADIEAVADKEDKE
jgi:transcriptional accessory protein Tex/SPT6